MMMEIKEEEPENAEASIVVTESGTETKDSDLHIEKDQSLITVIELGSDIVDKESQIERRDCQWRQQNRGGKWNLEMNKI